MLALPLLIVMQIPNIPGDNCGPIVRVWHSICQVAPKTFWVQKYYIPMATTMSAPYTTGPAAAAAAGAAAGSNSNSSSMLLLELYWVGRVGIAADIMPNSIGRKLLYKIYIFSLDFGI